MKLQMKIMLILSALIILIIGLLYFAFSEHINRSMEQQMGYSALDFAKTIAVMDGLGEDLKMKVPYEEINQYIETIRSETGYQYIIIMDMNRTQYSYPYEVGIGKPYKNGGEDDVLQKGIAYVSADRNKLISAIRGFAPIYYNGEQVGAVLVGLLTDQVQKEIEVNRKNLEKAIVVGLLIGFLVAFLLSMNIKKAIFGLEPKEIGMLLGERELIFNTIEKSLISIDSAGKILIYNKAAAVILDLPEHAEGHNLGDYKPLMTSEFLNIIRNKTNQYNQQLISGATHFIVNSCLMYNPNKEIVGLVANIELMNEAIELAYELTGYKEMVESLRAQNHEFLNKLHTLGGLIQLENYEEALDYIDILSIRSKEIQHILGEHISSKKISGLLLGKYNRFIEYNLNFELDHSSRVIGSEFIISEEGICSILGNIIENTFDVLVENNVTNGRCLVYINANKESIEISVHNNGPNIPDFDKDRVFEKGYSTKENNDYRRGQGLHIVKQLVDQGKGTLSFENGEGVTWHVKF